MANWQKKLNMNLIIASTAVVISLCALVVSIQEVRLMRSQQKVSLFPYLTISEFYNSEGFGIRIKNNGTGLAKINSFQVFNDQQYFDTWLQVADAYSLEEDTINYGIMQSNGIKDEIITPNEKVVLVYLDWTKATRDLPSRLTDLNIKICYSSLLNDYWLITNDETRMELDAPCKVDEEKEFAD
ncbi:MAG: hypothetical protein AAFP19_02710 [Bacteroidota bacterium]